MTSGFEDHGVKHLSASSINMWEECPGAWVARYLHDRKFSFGVAAQVGVLTEQVVQDVLAETCGFNEALAKAHKTFSVNNALNTNEKELKRIDDIEPMAVLALEELGQYGRPEFQKTIYGIEQQKINIMCKGHGWEIPVIGFLDFVFPEHNLVVDLKTTLRMPSVMSGSHRRQGGIYKAATGKDVKFLYVTPKKKSVFDIEDHEQIMDEVKTIILRQERMLKNMNIDLLTKSVPVAMNSFYWSGGDEQIRKELFGI